jgi:hypothetical protein
LDPDSNRNPHCHSVCLLDPNQHLHANGLFHF